MHTTFYFCLKFVVFTQLVFSKDIYQSVRLFDPSLSNISIVGSLGIPLDHVRGKKDIYIDLTCTKDQTAGMLDKGLNIEILIPDLTSFYKERNRPASPETFLWELCKETIHGMN